MMRLKITWNNMTDIKHVEDPPSSEKTALKFIIRLEFSRYDKTCEIHHSTYQKKPNVNIFLNTRNR